MAITFYLQSKKNPAGIYVRLRMRPIDAKARTKYLIDPKWFENGEVKKGSFLFDSLQTDLDYIRNKITMMLNNRKEEDIIDSNWLKELIK